MRPDQKQFQDTKKEGQKRTYIERQAMNAITSLEIRKYAVIGL